MNRKFIARASRWLHIYLSMISFVIVLFFSITGLTLNHAEYFQGDPVTIDAKGSIDSSWINPEDTNRIRKLEIVEFFRKTHTVKGALSDFRIDEREISLSFKAPSYEATAFIDRSNGSYSLSQTSQGAMAFFNDLHKGRDTGKAWLWVIDLSAILMTIISLTGLGLLLFIKRKRWSGLLLLLIGLLLSIAVYWWWGQ
jgi:uncharacterized protein